MYIIININIINIDNIVSMVNIINSNIIIINILKKC